MIFGDLTVDKAAGAILAHSLKVGKQSFRKGRTLSDDDIALLRKADFDTIVAVRLESTDLHENEAAERLATAIAGDNLSLSPTATGRCNLVAKSDGLAILDADTIDALNLTNEIIAISTVPPYRKVSKRRCCRHSKNYYLRHITNNYRSLRSHRRVSGHSGFPGPL